MLFCDIIRLGSTSAKLWNCLNNTFRILSSMVSSSWSLRCLLSILGCCNFSCPKEVMMILGWLCSCSHCLTHTIDSWNEIRWGKTFKCWSIRRLLFETKIFRFFSLFSILFTIFLLRPSHRMEVILFFFLLDSKSIIVNT